MGMTIPSFWMDALKFKGIAINILLVCLDDLKIKMGGGEMIKYHINWQIYIYIYIYIKHINWELYSSFIQVFLKK